MMADTTSSLTTFEVVSDAIDMLNDGNVILGGADIDKLERQRKAAA